MKKVIVNDVERVLQRKRSDNFTNVEKSSINFYYFFVAHKGWSVFSYSIRWSNVYSTRFVYLCWWVIHSDGIQSRSSSKFYSNLNIRWERKMDRGGDAYSHSVIQGIEDQWPSQEFIYQKCVEKNRYFQWRNMPCNLRSFAWMTSVLRQISLVQVKRSFVTLAIKFNRVHIIMSVNSLVVFNVKYIKYISFFYFCSNKDHGLSYTMVRNIDLKWVIEEQWVYNKRHKRFTASDRWLALFCSVWQRIEIFRSAHCN